MKWLLLPIPFLVPVAFHFAYQPINESWTVKRFGCGCPALDGSFRFNANDVNSLLWLGILAVCIVGWVSIVSRLFVHDLDKWRVQVMIIGILGLVLLSARMWALEGWL